MRAALLCLAVVAVGCDDPPVVDPAGSTFYTRRLHLSLNDDNLHGKFSFAQRLQATMANQPSRFMRSPRL